MNVLMKSAAALVMLTGCTMTTGGATEVAICDAWRDSLPTRSHADTEQTQQEIGHARAVQRSVCR